MRSCRWRRGLAILYLVITVSGAFQRGEALRDHSDGADDDAQPALPAGAPRAVAVAELPREPVGQRHHLRAINDARSIQEVMIFGIRTWAVLVFRLIIMLGFMLLLDPLLTLVSLVVLPLLFFTIHRLTGRIQRTSQESREHMARLTSLIEQTMSAIRAVQVFGREGIEQKRFEDASMNFVRAQLSSECRSRC